MKLTVKIAGSDGIVKAESTCEDFATLVYKSPYVEGDIIQLSSDTEGFIIMQLEDSISPTFALIKSDFMLPIPFGEKKDNYSPKNFTGELHVLWARKADENDIKAYRNLALNPLDSHFNTGVFPHAHANCETRGESQFAARNAINGNVANDDHGQWPYESWGVNQQADAEITVEFGRMVKLDKLIITLRSDFPHDNWWKEATIKFSDGSHINLKFVKTGSPQTFAISPKNVEWIAMCEMKKDETNPSLYPALIQIEAWGITC